MSDFTWTTAEGITLEIAEMEIGHIRNCIAMIERKWDEMAENNEYITADHWSLPGVVTIPGREYYRPKLEALKAELDMRQSKEAA